MGLARSGAPTARSGPTTNYLERYAQLARPDVWDRQMVAGAELGEVDVWVVLSQ